MTSATAAAGTIAGYLSAESSYLINSKGSIECSDVDHTLVPDSEVPPDVEQFLAALQRSVPPEFFDPTELQIKTTVCDCCRVASCLCFYTV
jgi:hypothetical protein